MSACVCGRIFRVNATSCNLTVLRQETVAEDIMRLTVQWQDRSREPHAGQFYMLRAWAADATPILSRPISVDDFDNQTGALTFLYQVKGEGTHKLAALKKDDTLTVTGPCGNGFDTAALAGQYKRIAIVTGSEGDFSVEEAEAAKAAGAVTVGLGPRILRCETAPLAALTSVMLLTGNLECPQQAILCKKEQERHRGW